MSDDEIAYLLSDAAPTQGRLRLSTLTFTPALMSSRRSKRLRAQASKGSCHRTHSTQVNFMCFGSFYLIRQYQQRT